jgi:hypothetical protein
MFYINNPPDIENQIEYPENYNFHDDEEESEDELNKDGLSEGIRKMFRSIHLDKNSNYLKKLNANSNNTFPNNNFNNSDCFEIDNDLRYIDDIQPEIQGFKKCKNFKFITRKKMKIKIQIIVSRNLLGDR